MLISLDLFLVRSVRTKRRLFFPCTVFSLFGRWYNCVYAQFSLDSNLDQEVEELCLMSQNVPVFGKKTTTTMCRPDFNNSVK